MEITLFVDGHQLERLTTLYHVIEKPASADGAIEAQTPAAHYDEAVSAPVPDALALDAPAVEKMKGEEAATQ
jgi:hypothetical protein